MRIGSERTGVPVAARTAFATAAIAGGTADSPTPYGRSVLRTGMTTISGQSLVRTTR
jgi:hypothetical protein